MASPQLETGVSAKTIEAFHAMWGNFPHTVLLLKKSREIVAVNKKAEGRGFVPCAKCFQVSGKEEIHAGCKGNLALEEGTAQRKVTYNKETGRVSDAYWLPVPTEKDLFLHFAVYTDLPTENQGG